VPASPNSLDLKQRTARSKAGGDLLDLVVRFRVTMNGNHTIDLDRVAKFIEKKDGTEIESWVYLVQQEQKPRVSGEL
jgi:hypothetical protein